MSDLIEIPEDRFSGDATQIGNEFADKLALSFPYCMYIYSNDRYTVRLAVIFQNPARNNFLEAGIVMQSYMLDTVQ